MLERLATIDREYIRSKVQAGYYTSEIELVRDAIRKMREADNQQRKLDDLRAMVLQGHEQAMRGETIPYTDELAAQAMEQAIKNHARKKPIRHEVKP